MKKPSAKYLKYLKQQADDMYEVQLDSIEYETCICGNEMVKGKSKYRGMEIDAYICSCGEKSYDLDDMQEISSSLKNT
jgi:hypothetical protein